MLFKNGVEEVGYVAKMKGYLKAAIFAHNNCSKLSKKHTEINFIEFVRYLSRLAKIGGAGLGFNVQEFSGSLVVFAHSAVGACLLFAKSIDFLQRDCEGVNSRRLSTGLVKNRKRRSSCASATNRKSSCRSSLVSASPMVGDVTMTDLEALCEELCKPSPLKRTGSPETLVKAKRPRSGSSVSEEPELPEFEAEENLLEVAVVLSPQPEVEIVTPDPSAGPKKLQVKGLDSKISFTEIQWARMMRADDITRDRNASTADLARRGTVNAAFYRFALWTIPRNRIVHDAISVAEAIDDLDSLIDELRANDDPEYFQDQQLLPPRHSRPSVGSSFAASRRQSIASDVFEVEEPTDRVAALVRDDASGLKKAIENGLERRGAKRDTLIEFDEIVPKESCARNEAASTFVKLLELASRNELRFKSVSVKGVFKIQNCSPSFILCGSSSSESSD